MASMTAAQVIALKAKIKAEMARRKGYGSLSTSTGYNYAKKDSAVNYSGTAYDFTTTPTKGGTVLTEHGQKTVDLLLRIAERGNLKKVAKGDPIPSSFNNDLSTWVD